MIFLHLLDDLKPCSPAMSPNSETPSQDLSLLKIFPLYLCILIFFQNKTDNPKIYAVRANKRCSRALSYVHDEFMNAICSSMFIHTHDTSVIKNFDCFKYCGISGVFLNLSCTVVM